MQIHYSCHAHLRKDLSSEMAEHACGFQNAIVKYGNLAYDMNKLAQVNHEFWEPSLGPGEGIDSRDAITSE